MLRGLFEFVCRLSGNSGGDPIVEEFVEESTLRCCNSLPSIGFELEAEVGIEPTHKGFADPCLTTWLLRHHKGRSLVEAGSRASGSFRIQLAYSHAVEGYRMPRREAFSRAPLFRQVVPAAPKLGEGGARRQPRAGKEGWTILKEKGGVQA
jgi:hypothetical protein